MKGFRLFVCLFLVTFLATVLNTTVSASWTYHGFVWSQTQDYPDPNVPGHVKSYNFYYPSNYGNYGYTHLKLAHIYSISWSAIRGIRYDEDGASCGNPSGTIICYGPGSDVWVQLPPPGGYIVTEHGYDAWLGDSDHPIFYTSYGNPLGATRYYFDGGF